MYYSQPKKLAFIGNGTILLHSTQRQSIKSKNKNWKDNVVIAWNLTTAQPFYTCPGLLIGISRDGSTFLTHRNIEFFNTEEEKFSVWETATGTEIALEAIDPDDYELHQRILISAQEQSNLTLQLNDVLNKFPQKTFRLTGYTRNSLDTWAMTPNSRYIVVTLSGDEAGFDWAMGMSIRVVADKTDLVKGKETHDIKVNRFQGDPLLNFSEEHNLLAISGGNESFTVYDVDRWRKLRELWVEGFEYVVSFNPKNKWFVAVSAQKYIREADKSKTLFFIYYLDIESLVQDGAVIRRGNEKGVIEETGRVERLLFHPNGQYLASLLSDNSIHIWEIESRKLITQLKFKSLK